MFALKVVDGLSAGIEIPLRQNGTVSIGRAADGKGDDDAHRAGRVVLRNRHGPGCGCQQQEERGDEGLQVLHWFSPGIRGSLGRV